MIGLLGLSTAVAEPPLATKRWTTCTCCHRTKMRWWGSGPAAVMFCPTCDRLQLQ